MIDKILSGLSSLIIGTISTLGYGGIVLMMAIESACIPLPSEVIMPFSGSLVASGRFDLNMVAIAGAVGCLLGSYVAYFAGAYGGRRFLEQYGRWVLIAPHELEAADRFFDRWGSPAVFFSRLLPVVRTFIAFPAGIARMPQLRFHIYTFVGSWPWCFVLAYVGKQLGDKWNTDPRFHDWFHRFHLVVEIALVAGIVWFVWTHWKKRGQGMTAA